MAEQRAKGRDTSPQDTDLSRDEIFDLMSNHRRRYAIYYCKRTEGPISLSTLAEKVAAWEQDKEIAELTSAERKTVYTSLQQTHLPRLDRAGVVEFENGEVELTEQVQALDFYLDVVPESSIPWSLYYFGLALLALFLTGGFWTGFLPQDTLFPLLSFTFLTIVLLISATYHTLLTHRQQFEEFEKPP